MNKPVKRILGVTATVLAFGCSVLGVDRFPLSISLTSKVDLPPGSVFKVTISGDQHDVDLGVQREVRYGIASSAPGAGQYNVTAALVNAAGVTLATASFRQQFRDGWEHGIEAVIDTTRPLQAIICAWEVAAPIEPSLSSARKDSLFIMYGGRPKNVLC